MNQPAPSASDSCANDPADLPTWVRELLQCPCCGGDLHWPAGEGVQCSACDARFAIEGGIPMLLPS